MADYIEWPAVLKQIDATIPLLKDSFTASAPSLGGQVRGVRSLAARWVYGFSFKVWSRDEHLAWRSMMSRNYGLAGLIRVPICDCKFAPKLFHNGLEISDPPGLIPYADDVTHSDDTYFDDDLSSALSLGADAGSSTIDVTTDNSLAIYPGHYFSDGERFYTVSTVETLAAQQLRITFSPRLRQAIPLHFPVSFRRIYCLMKMRSEDMLAVEAQLLKFGMAQVQFEEQLL